jgi:hypothetical protein
MNTFHTMLFRISALRFPEYENLLKNPLHNPADLLLTGALGHTGVQVV